MQSRGVCCVSVCLCVCKLFLRESLLLRQKWLDRDQSCTGWSPSGRASNLCSRSRSRSKVMWYGRFCAGHENRFLSQANNRIATKLTHDGPQVRLQSLHPGCAQGQGQCQRSRATGTFVLARKTLLLPGKWPDCDQTCTRWSPGQRAYRMCPVSRSRSNVTWYGHFCARPKIAFSQSQRARLRPNLHTMVSRSACIHDVLKVKVKVTWYGHLCWHENRGQNARLQPNLHTMKRFSWQQKSARIAVFKGQL